MKALRNDRTSPAPCSAFFLTGWQRRWRQCTSTYESKIVWSRLMQAEMRYRLENDFGTVKPNKD